MNSIRPTPEFTAWLKTLKDGVGRAAIVNRIKRAQGGNFGDTAPVGEGVYEMRVFVGPGYRVYYFQQGETVYVLTNGGDKGSQQRDIARAKELAKQYRD